MGTTYTSSIVVGFRVSDVLNVVNTETVMKKFDPDTGMPYDVVKVDTTYTLFGVSVEPYPDDWEYVKEKPIGAMKVFSCGGDSKDYCGYVIGLELTTDHRKPNRSYEFNQGVHEITQDAILSISSLVEKEAQSRGCNVTPKLYCVNYVGC